jgi:calcium-dependent protein kinase
MHSQKVAHRDIKPENFLMSSKKTLELKLIDFGLSYEWKEDMRKELLSEGRNKLIGTSYYIAPEVLRLDYDQRCDIWSAGVILYILVTGCPPFDG